MWFGYREISGLDTWKYLVWIHGNIWFGYREISGLDTGKYLVWIQGNIWFGYREISGLRLSLSVSSFHVKYVNIIINIDNPPSDSQPIFQHFLLVFKPFNLYYYTLFIS